MDTFDEVRLLFIPNVAAEVYNAVFRGDNGNEGCIDDIDVDNNETTTADDDEDLVDSKTGETCDDGDIDDNDSDKEGDNAEDEDLKL